MATTTTRHAARGTRGAVARSMSKVPVKRAVASARKARVRSSPSALRASEIRTSIDAALHAFAAAEAACIGVRVRGGAVALEGSVASWAARQAIVKAVKDATGLATIDDTLLVWSSDRGTRSWVHEKPR